MGRLRLTAFDSDGGSRLDKHRRPSVHRLIATPWCLVRREEIRRGVAHTEVGDADIGHGLVRGADDSDHALEDCWAEGTAASQFTAWCVSGYSVRASYE